jgi:hypothetical protein
MNLLCYIEFLGLIYCFNYPLDPLNPRPLEPFYLFRRRPSSL